jgi:DNA-binding MarR family transcriptional regulator
MDKTNGGFLISQIKQIQGRVFDSMLQEAGIEEFNGAQGRILFVLWQEDHLPIMELSRRTGLAKTTMTGMLDRMESQGFLTREPDSRDRRQLRIVLTNKARNLRNQYDSVSSSMNELFYKGFTDEEIIEFEDHLKRILNNLTMEEE